MGCASSSQNPKENPNETEGGHRNSKDKSPKKSVPQTPTITIDYCEDRIPSDDEENNDNFNNGNEGPKTKTNNNANAKTDSSENVKETNGNKDDAPVTDNVVPPNQSVAGNSTTSKSEENESVKENESKTEDPESHNEDIVLEAQEQFNTAIRLASLALKAESVLKYANRHIRCLKLSRALPHSIRPMDLMKNLQYLQELDVSDNQLGPQAFRVLMLSMMHNATITSLNVANNHTDTDSAISVGKMLASNTTLVSLNVSGNYLGKDFFSRSVGPALATNKTLHNLNCEGIGSIDVSCLVENAAESNCLQTLNLSHNTLQKTDPTLDPLLTWLKNPDCSLEVLQLKTLGMKNDDLVKLSESVKLSPKLQSLDVSANEVSDSAGLFEFLTNCSQCKSLNSLFIENTKPQQSSKCSKDIKVEVPSMLSVLRLSGCNVDDDFLSAFATVYRENGLSNLEELNLSNNGNLTLNVLQQILETTKDVQGKSKLQRLFYGMNAAEGIADCLNAVNLNDLLYLNLRRARISPGGVGKLASLTSSGILETVVLDGIKLAGSKALQEILGTTHCSIIAVSLDSCQLGDSDIDQLSDAISCHGLQLCMLKLTGNRIQDPGVTGLVKALTKHATHPLKLVDLQSNQITAIGAVALSELFIHDAHKSQIHSLNVSNNAIGGEGLEALVSRLGAGRLTTLVANRQNASYTEENMEPIYNKLAGALGFSKEPIEQSCDLPKLPHGLTVKLKGLGGFQGEFGRLLDSSAIVTDYQVVNRCLLTLSDILQLVAALKGQNSEDCLLTKDDWNNAIGAGKEAPTWLQLADHRERALYLSHLPAAVTTNKLEGLLETEADVSVDEVVLMKDELTRKNNGFAWVLLSDKKFIPQAVNFYNNGEAKVFSQSFVLSSLNVKVDDDGSQQAEQSAREMVRRAAERSVDEAAHRKLIQQSYRESQDRHAYRLAHPAYADGRIW